MTMGRDGGSWIPCSDSACWLTAVHLKFGWVQELDGDPGAVSQWYRNKSGLKLKDVKNNLTKLGISFFVYTNVDNC